MSRVLAVVSVIGKDQKGVVARFATHLAEHAINIEDLQQHVIQGMFVMDMLVDLSEMNQSLDELVAALQGIGDGIGMEVRLALKNERRLKRIAVLVSKEPHCLTRLIEDEQQGELRGRIACVLSNHGDLAPLAHAAGLTFEHHGSDDKAAHMSWLLKRLRHHQVDLVVLARYMQVLPTEIVQAYQHRIINIHPSLLPHFPGPAPYRRAWEEGVRVTGCTAHFVTDVLDEGPIILQDVFHINVGIDSVEDVRRNGQELEGSVLSKAVRYYLNEQLLVVDDRVAFKPGLSDLLGPPASSTPDTS